MYSLGPFVALDSRLGTAEQTASGGNTTAQRRRQQKQQQQQDALDDLHKQFRLLWDHCYNAATGLLVHGYDASRTASWASHATGASPVVWDRSLGWFMMALVDTLEMLSAGTKDKGDDSQGRALRDDLTDMYRRLAPAVVRFADKGPGSGGWFQAVDVGRRREGNYIVSSATAMFTCALLKGARLGYLVDPEDLAAAKGAGRAAHALLLRDFVVAEQDGMLGWGGTVGVCSLNSTATYEVGLLHFISSPPTDNSTLFPSPPPSFDP
jgi:rhamnogalacturonyl hydrolase YesR